MRFVCLFFETPLKDFPFHSTILLILWIRYLQTRRNTDINTQKHADTNTQKGIYPSSRTFFKTPDETPDETTSETPDETPNETPDETLQSQEKWIFQRPADLNFKRFPFGVYYEVTHKATKLSTY